MKHNDLAGIEQARDPGVITHSAADDQPLLVYTIGILGKKSLSGCEHTATEELPLSAMGMP